jgi:hypothetical protein
MISHARSSVITGLLSRCDQTDIYFLPDFRLERYSASFQSSGYIHSTSSFILSLPVNTRWSTMKSALISTMEYETSHIFSLLSGFHRKFPGCPDHFPVTFTIVLSMTGIPATATADRTWQVVTITVSYSIIQVQGPLKSAGLVPPAG